MTQHIYSVPKISCGHCVAAITNELKELDGVQQISGDPQAKTITVEARPPVTDAQIRDRLAEIGYPAAS